MISGLNEIIKKFEAEGRITGIRSFGNGHINDTYLVSIKEGHIPGYILQRKNHQVFKDVPAMMENIIRVTGHIRANLKSAGEKDIHRKVVTHVKTRNGDYFFRDQKGNFWTLCLFIEGCTSVEKIEMPEHAYLAGKAFGQFQKQVSGLPGKPLNETIPDFHNIDSRLNNLKKAFKINFQNRKEKVKTEINFALDRAAEMRTLYNLQKEGKLPLRITHNDTKINNILFDQHGRVLCVIDLDTVMPGLVHYDFGDAIRTAANNADEDETDLSYISVNLPVFEAFTKGFLEELSQVLSMEEKKWLAHSAGFMAYIMGLRFLTDYIEGDVYYKINHSEHNIERAKSQFRLVEEIEKQMEEMKRIVALYS